MTDERVFDCETQGAVTVLHMVHGKANLMDLELARGLSIELARQRDSGRALVFAAEGPIFSGGVDLLRVLEGGPAYLADFLPAFHHAMLALYGHPTPTVAAVGGHAIAGGCVLALACDRRIAARGRGRIGLPELEVGVPFPPLAFEIVRAALPERALREVVFLGETFSVERAHELSLVDELVPTGELLERAVAVAERLAAIPRKSYELQKRMLRAPALELVAHHGEALEREALAAWSSPECLEAIRAYVERTLGK